MLNIKKNLQSKNLPPTTYHLKPNKGFTLIELLVVIAIIGILSSVVLASLNSVRTKGADAGIKSNFNNMRSQVQIYYDSQSPQSYGGDVQDGDCTTAGSMFADDSVIANAINSAQTISGGGVVATCFADDEDVAIGTAATSWAMSVPLKSDPTHSWCVDSTGVSIDITGVALDTGNVASCQ